jgi:hypothetical protein
MTLLCCLYGSQPILRQVTVTIFAEISDFAILFCENNTHTLQMRIEFGNLK